MIKFTRILTIVAILFTSTAMAQTENLGTYQIEVLGRGNPYIPESLDEIIDENRHATDVVYVSLGTKVRVKILPHNTINSPEFKAVEERIVNVVTFN